jgi:hypothetical protein
MEIFSYIPVMISIRSKEFMPPLTSMNLVEEATCPLIHKRVAKKLGADKYPCALVFDNELILTRNLADTNNNEIKLFVTSGTPWDILILGKCDLEATVVPGFTLVEKLSDTTTFFNEYVYLISHTMMQKIIDNNLSVINTFKYTDHFLTSVKGNIIGGTHYVVGKISAITHAKQNNIGYIWTPYADL